MVLAKEKREIICVECGNLDSPYKCPQCKNPFCSVDCSKVHKSKHQQEQETGSNIENKAKFNQDDNSNINNTEPGLSSQTFDSKEDYIVPPEKLQLLSYDTNIKLLMQDSKFIEVLKELDNPKLTSVQREKFLLSLLNTNQDFKRFADVALNIVLPKEEDSHNDTLNDDIKEKLKQLLQEDKDNDDL